MQPEPLRSHKCRPIPRGSRPQHLLHQRRLPRRDPRGPRLPLPRAGHGGEGEPRRHPRLLPRVGGGERRFAPARPRREVPREGAQGDGRARHDGGEHPRGVRRLRRDGDDLQSRLRRGRRDRSGALRLLRRASVHRLQGDHALRHRGAEAALAAARARAASWSRRSASPSRARAPMRRRCARRAVPSADGSHYVLNGRRSGSPTPATRGCSRCSRRCRSRSTASRSSA